MQGDIFLGVESKGKKKTEGQEVKIHSFMNSFCPLQLAACCSPIASAQLCPLQLLFPDCARFSCSTAPRSHPLQVLLPDCVRKLAAAPLQRRLQLLLPNSHCLRSRTDAVTCTSPPPMQRYGYLQYRDLPVPDRLATSSNWLATLPVLYRQTESHSSVLKILLYGRFEDSFR